MVPNTDKQKRSSHCCTEKERNLFCSMLFQKIYITDENKKMTISPGNALNGERVQITPQ